jgi:hypothetical protein
MMKKQAPLYLCIRVEGLDALSLEVVVDLEGHLVAAEAEVLPGQEGAGPPVVVSQPEMATMAGEAFSYNILYFCETISGSVLKNRSFCVFQIPMYYRILPCVLGRYFILWLLLFLLLHMYILLP